ncbi:MAG: universal stress protein [Thermoplasmata archaeon]
MSEKKGKTLLIASYKRRYSEDAVERIKKIIREMQPERIVIIKLVEERPTKELVDAAVGMEEKSSMQETVKNEKKFRADELAADLFEKIKGFDIPVEVSFRMGDNISDEIMEEFQRQEANLLIIHDKKKGALDKLFGSCTTEEILNKMDKKKLIKL